MNKIKNDKAITLVVLVITVIVMLILAGVSISILTENGGLFDKTRGAAEIYNEAGQNEANQITYFENQMDNYMNNVNNNEAWLQMVKNLKVGDYVNYDAGTWTQSDLDKITNSTGNPTIHSSVNDVTAGNSALPAKQGEFGGFELKQSRNKNSTPYSSAPIEEGWRIWDKDEQTGILTLISAGHPETYYHGTNSSTSVELLTKRDYSMYVNNNATTAKVLTATEAFDWYNKNFNTNYTAGGFYTKTLSYDSPISILNNGAYCWYVTAYSNGMYTISPSKNYFGFQTNHAMGIRILISLQPGLMIDLNSGNGSKDNPWKIVE